MRRTVYLVLFSVLLGSAWLSPALGASFTFTTIDPPSSLGTGASGINDAGQIVGTFSDAGFRQHGFLLSGGRFSTPH